MTARLFLLCLLIAAPLRARPCAELETRLDDLEARLDEVQPVGSEAERAATGWLTRADQKIPRTQLGNLLLAAEMAASCGSPPRSVAPPLQPSDPWTRLRTARARVELALHSRPRRALSTLASHPGAIGDYLAAPLASSLFGLLGAPSPLALREVKLLPGGTWVASLGAPAQPGLVVWRAKQSPRSLPLPGEGLLAVHPWRALHLGSSRGFAALLESSDKRGGRLRSLLLLLHHGEGFRAVGPASLGSADLPLEMEIVAGSDGRSLLRLESVAGFGPSGGRERRYRLAGGRLLLEE